MPSNITVKIKVPVYIRKFLIYESENKAEPLIFKRRHHFIVNLIPLLCSNYRYKHSLITDKHDENPNFTETQIMLPWNKSGYYDIRWANSMLSPQNEREYRKILTLYFNVFVTKFVHELQKQKTMNRIDTIRSIMGELMIDEDEWNYESFYRYYSRLTEVKSLINVNNPRTSNLILS